MKTKNFLILGGYGNTGFFIADLLLQKTMAKISLAGRNIKKAEKAAETLATKHQTSNVKGIYLDAADQSQLLEAFKGIDMLIVASSTVQYSSQIVEAALEAGIDYLDVQVSGQKIKMLKDKSDSIKSKGCCFITDGGFHPGLPAALIAYGAEFFDEVQKAKVGSYIKINWASLNFSDATGAEFVEEMNSFNSLFLKNGKWKKARWMGSFDYIYMDFGSPYGKQYCIPMFLEELKTLPEDHPSLRDMGFFVGSMNWVVDWFIFPIAALILALFPKRGIDPMGKLMWWGLRTFTKPPYATILKLEASGKKDGQEEKIEIMLSHEDGYLFTAIPVVACLMQYLDGTPRPGLWMQANFVEPNKMMKDMQKMGIQISIHKP